MLRSNTKQMLKLVGGAVFFLCLGTLVYAGAASASAASGGVGIGKLASTVQTNFNAVAKFITAASYIAGMGFGVGAVLKFKAHKDNPTQVQLSHAIVLLFISAALLFIPSVFSTVGKTLFATSGETAFTSGQIQFKSS
jgi:intracellular multiplication protein IcmD